MSKKNFGDNLKPKKKRTLTDKEINEVIGGESEKPKRKKEKLIRFTIRVPENIYNELDETASKIGVTKKSILMQGLRAELNRVNNK